MSIIDQIKEPIRQDLKDFEPFFKRAVESDIKLLDLVLHYIFRRKGKMMRPMIIFLSAGINGSINRRTYHAASTIELLHSATLLHDDVVDNSNERRGVLSVNAIWKNKISVLVGDYILGKGFTYCIKEKEYDMLNHISIAIEDMSKGEILQMEKARKTDTSREVYFDIIKKKTASLLAASTAVGTCSVTSDTDVIDRMRNIGELTGIAFQIKDDILDLSSSKITGKPSYTDIKEQKVTLPLICALDKGTPSDVRRVKKLLKRKKKSATHINEIVNFIKEKEGVEDAKVIMNDYIDRSIEELHKFPASAYRESMELLIRYVAKRVK